MVRNSTLKVGANVVPALFAFALFAMTMPATAGLVEYSFDGGDPLLAPTGGTGFRSVDASDIQLVGFGSYFSTRSGADTRLGLRETSSVFNANKYLRLVLTAPAGHPLRLMDLTWQARNAGNDGNDILIYTQRASTSARAGS